jgi:hypothetical protein
MFGAFLGLRLFECNYRTRIFMDVMLDSNVYLSDLRMESIRFKNLFDYLRRTKCSLVLPRLVREETIAKYRHLLDVHAKKAAQAVEHLNRLIVNKNSEIHFTAPKSAYAARDLRNKFRDLEKTGSIRYYPDTAGVDVSEVFLRGVKRRRPANSQGEELRDVIIWLIALQYAENEKKHLALVTNDGGFWNDTEIHEHLKQDVDERKVNVSLFRTIDDFIKGSAPQPKSVEDAYVSKVFDVITLADDITAASKRGLSTWKRFFLESFTVRSANLESAKFVAGTVYEIDPQTKFAELTYELLIVADLAFREESFPPSFGVRGLGTVFEPLGAWGTLSQMAIAHGPSATRDFASILPAYHSTLGLGLGPSRSEPTESQHVTIRTYAVSAKAQVSIRLVEDKPTETELDRVEITKVEEMAQAEFVPSGG